MVNVVALALSGLGLLAILVVERRTHDTLRMLEEIRDRLGRSGHDA